MTRRGFFRLLLGAPLAGLVKPASEAFPLISSKLTLETGTGLIGRVSPMEWKRAYLEAQRILKIAELKNARR